MSELVELRVDRAVPGTTVTAGDTTMVAGPDGRLSSVVNLTGIQPTEFKCLVLPDPVDDKFAGSSLLKPTATSEQDKWATTKGTLIAVSPLAFSYASATEWEDAGAEKPKPGQRIIYAKYAGNRYTSPRDGKDYLLINDKDVCAVIED